MDEVKGSISTSQFVKSGKVEVDGMIWEVTLPGAGRELQMSKAQRRMELLQKKIDKGDYTEEDADKMDSYEDFMMDYFQSIFKDDTGTNEQVKKWLDETPTSIIMLALKDIRKKAEDAETPA